MWPENQLQAFPTNIHLLKVNNEKTRKRSEICSELAINTLE